ncbi:MAG: hypothetical protein J0M29_00370 [Chitinophagales bacterium]|nr:hypothetical protein [Chitinophagales bacterium]
MIQGFFISLSGDDYTIIRKLSKRTQIRFLLIGILVSAITLTSLFSWFVMLSNLIELSFFVFLLALFISWMITNIYLLTLYTLSKRVLPCKGKGGSSVASTVGKYLFLAMLGLIVATSFSVLIFQKDIDVHLEQYRTQKIRDYQQLSNQISQSDSILVSQLVLNSHDITTKTFFQDYLASQRKKKIESEGRMRSLVRQSPFYIQSIVILYTKYPKHWPFTILFVLVFISPAILKHYLAETNEYYTVKREIEMNIVEDEYKSFKDTYQKLFSGQKDRVIVWREIYEDPPYNTRRKKEYRPHLSDQDILLKELYHG